MQVVILETKKEIAKSLQRAISLKFKCIIEYNFDINELEGKYKGSDSVFLIDACIAENNKINEEGWKLAHLINDRLHLKVIVFGLENKKTTTIPYFKIPYRLADIYNEILKPAVVKRQIDIDLMVDKYEYFRSKISHDYLQYVEKNLNFYKYLILNFYKYADIIFGINLKEEKGIDQRTIEESVQRFEKEKDSTILHSLMRDFKMDNIKKIQPEDFLEIKDQFFENLNLLVGALDNNLETSENLETKVAENFFFSWYLWRKLFFLEEYNQYFSDGFYKGCFRILLLYGRPYYQEVKKNTLKTNFNTSNTLESIRLIKLEIKKLKDISNIF